MKREGGMEEMEERVEGEGVGGGRQQTGGGGEGGGEGRGCCQR